MNHLISQYLKIDLQQASALVDLLRFENQLNQTVTWKENTYQLAEAKTQADVLHFIQAVGQTVWFKGHDRSKYPQITDEQLNKHYFELAQRMGLTQAAHLPETFVPQFAVVLGSSELEVKARVLALKESFDAGKLPKQGLVLGLGCNRQLGVSVPQTEEDSKKRLLEKHREPNEMEMVSLLTTDMLEQNPKFKLQYQAINTTANVKSREEANCVKTADTATSLKQYFELSPGVDQLQRPITVTIASRQPYAERQKRDVQKQLGEGYDVQVLGHEYNWERYSANPAAINVIRGELARLFNISFTPEYLKQFDQALTEAELAEIKQLCQPKQSPYLSRLQFNAAPAPQAVQADQAQESLHSNINLGK